MIEFFLVLFFVISLILAVVAWEMNRRRKADRKLAARLIAELHRDRFSVRLEQEEWEFKYRALELGMDEQEEIYQQMLLEQYDGLAEEIERLNGTITMKCDIIDAQEDELEYHRLSCLPHLSDIRLERAIREELEKTIP